MNKYLSEATVNVPNAAGGVIQVVDGTTGDGPAYSEVLTSDTVTLRAFAVAVLTFATDAN